MIWWASTVKWVRDHPTLVALLVGVILSAIALNYLHNVKADRDRYKDERNAAITRANELQAALIKSEAAARLRIGIVEKDRAETEDRNATLTHDIETIEASNETITCPVPDVLRDALGVRRRQTP